MGSPGIATVKDAMGKPTKGSAGRLGTDGSTGIGNAGIGNPGIATLSVAIGKPTKGSAGRLGTDGSTGIGNAGIGRPGIATERTGNPQDIYLLAARGIIEGMDKFLVAFLTATLAACGSAEAPAAADRSAADSGNYAEVLEVGSEVAPEAPAPEDALGSPDAAPDGLGPIPDTETAPEAGDAVVDVGSPEEAKCRAHPGRLTWLPAGAGCRDDMWNFVCYWQLAEDGIERCLPPVATGVGWPSSSDCPDDGGSYTSATKGNLASVYMSGSFPAMFRVHPLVVSPKPAAYRVRETVVGVSKCNLKSPYPFVSPTGEARSFEVISGKQVVAPATDFVPAT